MPSRAVGNIVLTTETKLIKIGEKGEKGTGMGNFLLKSLTQRDVLRRFYVLRLNNFQEQL